MTPERWSSFSLAVQLTNIDSELARAESLERKHDKEHARACLFRALELAGFSAFGTARAAQKKEMRRLYELIADLTQEKREYPETIGHLRQLLQPFAMLVAKERDL